jgi:Prp8 binding protein
MSGEKRAASASFGSSQLVKRQKSDANMNSSALAKTSGGSGAMVQGVSLTQLFESIRLG